VVSQHTPSTQCPLAQLASLVHARPRGSSAASGDIAASGGGVAASGDTRASGSAAASTPSGVAASGVSIVPPHAERKAVPARAESRRAPGSLEEEEAKERMNVAETS
jgi:hypothetical protein